MCQKSFYYHTTGLKPFLRQLNLLDTYSQTLFFISDMQILIFIEGEDTLVLEWVKFRNRLSTDID